MATLRDLVPTLGAGDTSQPAITCYDRSGGPTHGERIELSARVLLTWAAKAGNALQDELLAEPGTTVGLALPAHWRAGYWALATWWVGATLVTGPAAVDADVLVTDDPALAGAAGGEAVLVTPAALARAHPGPVPAGVMDEARELASFGDRFVPAASAAAGDTGWLGPAGTRPYAAPLRGDTRRLAVVTEDLDEALSAMTSLWAGGGSLVLVRASSAPDDLEGLLRAERAERA
ncbi:TIGR03089 family protein [Arsenicicoccus sp. oral taxon 190]|uniref:TIGR03089 family protein n=1 Tax=Arsenicicoccus sp. oral taxon 190 TaxID=1658671 RepID=UPI00067A049E|nr:TIGR03089 family protein [Arsenicicoccus sp. oral taxon 190]AKT52386.1 hypothetical protein ADJ73_15905 [Arsenicicoccus sp. oral taxon 190]